MRFVKSFKKTAGVFKGFKPSTLDKAGLVALGVPVAWRAAKELKERKYTDAAMSGVEGAGLGLLYRSVQKAHP